MTNLKTNSLYKITTFIVVFINLFSINALSEESHIIKIIEKEWNRTQTLKGKFHQKIDGDKVISGNFFIEKPYIVCVFRSDPNAPARSFSILFFVAPLSNSLNSTPTPVVLLP